MISSHRQQRKSRMLLSTSMILLCFCCVCQGAFVRHGNPAPGSFSGGLVTPSRNFRGWVWTKYCISSTSFLVCPMCVGTERMWMDTGLDNVAMKQNIPKHTKLLGFKNWHSCIWEQTPLIKCCVSWLRTTY